MECEGLGQQPQGRGGKVCYMLGVPRCKGQGVSPRSPEAGGVTQIPKATTMSNEGMGVSGGTCGEEPVLTGAGFRDGGQPVGSGRAGGWLLRAEAGCLEPSSRWVGGSLGVIL